MARALDRAIDILLSIFEGNLPADGSRNTLTKGEFKDMVQNNLSIGPKMKDKQIQSLMEDLDNNADEQMDFKEYLHFVAELGVIRHDGLGGR